MTAQEAKTKTAAALINIPAQTAAAMATAKTAYRAQLPDRDTVIATIMTEIDKVASLGGNYAYYTLPKLRRSTTFEFHPVDAFDDVTTELTRLGFKVVPRDLRYTATYLYEGFSIEW